jgi:VCBS repeat-containing protein
MQVNVTYDQSVGSLPAGFVAAVNYVVNYFDTTFTNPVTVNIDLGYGEVAGQSLGSGALGESETFFNSVSYSQAVSALKANQPSSTQQAAYATLPGSSPLSGGTLWLSTAEEKALGLLAGNNSAIDGYIGLSSTYPFSYAAGVTPAAGQYYFEGVLAHELSEVLGRSSMLGQGLGGTTSYTPMDLFRYSAASTRQLTTGGPAYFSINNGTTNLDSWNTNPGGDLGDWAGSAGTDSFLAFSSSGQLDWITQPDLTLMNVLGWDMSPSGGISVTATASEALQGGASVMLLAGTPSITDPASSTLASATVKIANGVGSAIPGDELYVNGQQSGTVAGGAITVSWNDSTKVLTLAGTASIATYDTLLSQVAYKSTGTDSSSGSHPQRTATWTVNDGSTNLSATSQIAVDRAPVASNDTGADVVGVALSVAAAGGVLANDTDLDADALTVSRVSDTAQGAGVVGQPLAGVYGHLTLKADGSYTYAADITSAINSAPTGSHLHDVFSYTASDGKGGTSGATTLDITLDRPLVLTVANLSPSQTQALPASSLFQANDPDGDAITKYAFYDTGTGGAHFLVNGVVQATNQEIDVTAAQLAQVTYQPGVGADTLRVRAYDSGQWSPWSSNFTVADTTPPTVSSVVMSAAGVVAGAGDLAAGSAVTVTLTMSEVVTVAGGVPTLTLNDGGTATYTGGSSSNALTFSYSVLTGQNTADLAVTAIHLGTATVKDGAGNAANLTAAVTNPTGILQIDTTPPVVSSVAATSPSGNPNLASTITLTLHMSEAVTVAGGIPTLTLDDGGTAYYTGGSGTNALTFGYAVAAGQKARAPKVMAVNLNSAAIADGAGNTANLTGAITNLVTNSDASNAAPWSSQVTVLDGSGNVTARTINNRNGAHWTNVYDTSGTASWSWFTNAYDAKGNLVSQSGETHDGTHWLSLYDVSNAYTWSSVTLTFDSNWNQTSLTGTLDDGSPTATPVGVTAALDVALWFQTPYDANWNTSPFYTVPTGGYVELGSGNGVSNVTVTFLGSTGTLKIDNASSFKGAIGGQLAIGDVIDLADVTAGHSATIGYTGNNSPGTLTVSDGTHTASIALLGNYSLASFSASSDGHGGTSIVDQPPLASQGHGAPSGSSGVGRVAEGTWNQHMGLLSQFMASFAPSSSGEVGASKVVLLANESGQGSSLTHPIENHQHD